MSVGLRDSPAESTDKTPLTLVECAEMTDGDCDTGDGVTGSEYMIGIDLGSTQFIGTLVIDISGGSAASYIAAGPVCRYSSNNSDWFEVSNSEFTDTEGSCDDQITVTFNGQSARYFRVYCSYQPYLLNINASEAEFNPGYAEIEIPALTCSGAGNYYGEMTLPALTCEGRGGGIASMELPALTCEAEGSQENIGNAEMELPAFTCEGRGGGIASMELPALTCEAEGTPGNVGGADIVLPALTCAAEGKCGSIGTAALTLPLLRIAAHGFRGNTGIGGLTLPLLEIEAEGALHPTGEADLTLPLLAIYATGSNDICRYYDYVLEHER